MTIHYTMTPQPDWSWEEIRRRLVSIGEEIKAHCGFEEVEEVQEFRRVRREWEPRDRRETYYWMLRHARRCFQIPELAHYRFNQEAKRGLILATWPGLGSDMCNIGCVEYPSTFRRSQANLPVDWREVLAHPKEYPGAVRAFHEFATKYQFQIVRTKGVCRRWYERYWPGWNIDSVGSALIAECSEKPGYRRLAIVWPSRGDEPILMLADDEEVECTDEMLKDLERLHGRGTYQVDKTREWRSFCETKHANSSEFGGVRNFLRVHQGVCAALKICEEHGFVVEVKDKSGFWGTWDTETLLRKIDASAEDFEALHVLGLE